MSLKIFLSMGLPFLGYEDIVKRGRASDMMRVVSSLKIGNG
jgi:hypothetical protein